MKTFEVEVNDRRDIKKVQRIAILLTRFAEIFEQYPEIQITIVAKPKRQWWKIFGVWMNALKSRLGIIILVIILVSSSCATMRIKCPTYRDDGIRYITIKRHL